MLKIFMMLRREKKIPKPLVMFILNQAFECDISDYICTFYRTNDINPKKIESLYKAAWILNHSRSLKRLYPYFQITHGEYFDYAYKLGNGAVLYYVINIRGIKSPESIYVEPLLKFPECLDSFLANGYWGTSDLLRLLEKACDRGLRKTIRILAKTPVLFGKKVVTKIINCGFAKDLAEGFNLQPEEYKRANSISFIEWELDRHFKSVITPLEKLLEDAPIKVIDKIMHQENFVLTIKHVSELLNSNKNFDLLSPSVLSAFVMRADLKDAEILRECKIPKLYIYRPFNCELLEKIVSNGITVIKFIDEVDKILIEKKCDRLLSFL